MGLKKCIPITRLGLITTEAKVSIEKEEVLVAKIVFLEQMLLSFLNKFFLTSSSSGIHSIITYDRMRSNRKSKNGTNTPTILSLQSIIQL